MEWLWCGIYRKIIPYSFSSNASSTSNSNSTSALTTPVTLKPAISTTTQISTQDKFKKAGCELYPTPNDGMCKKWLAGRYIYPFRKTANYIRGVDTWLSTSFSQIDTLIKMIRHSKDKFNALKNLWTTYKLFNPNIIVPPDPELKIIVQQIQNVTTACIEDIKEVYCRTYLPPCVNRRYKWAYYVSYQQPCYEMCRYVNDTRSCGKVKELMAAIKKSKIVGTFECTIFEKQQLGRCYMAPHMKGLLVKFVRDYPNSLRLN